MTAKTMDLPLAPPSPGATLPVAEPLYEVALRITGLTDFGFGLEALRSGAALPPQGARIDIAFEGRLEGPRLRGAVVGVDYGLLRADGRFDLEVRATITTDDGARIALHAGGIFRPADGAVREHVRLTTASPAYMWVNALEIWATGTADVQEGVITLSAYAA